MTALDWPECRNARDLGGLPTVDGLLLRAAVLYRSDGLFRLSAAGVAIAMTNTLAHLDERYGGAESYLLRIGITAEEITAVRERLVRA
jgi:hypothetical protein